MAEEMRQYAPFPSELQELVDHLAYRPGWTFELKDIERDPEDTHGASAGGLTFIGLTGSYTWDKEHGQQYVGAQDAYHIGTPRPVYFYFPVPAATFNRASWQRWLFDRLLEVERHEAMEHFVIEGEHPFSPTHGPGDDPYIIHEYATPIQKATSFRGEVTTKNKATYTQVQGEL